MLSLLVAATVMILALLANLASTGKPILQRKQCCGPVLMGSLASYPDPDSQSGSRRAKMTHKDRKKSINFIFLSAGCSLLRAEGFPCSLDISKLQFLI